MSKNQFTVYQIKNLLTGRKYIGSTANYALRVYYHQRTLENNTHSNVLLQHDWNMGHSFEFTPLATLSEEQEARNLEKQLIMRLQDTEEGVYNIYHNTKSEDVMYRRNWNGQKKRKFGTKEAYEMARLKFDDGLSYSEIANMFNCHPVTVFWNVNCYLKGVTQYVATRKS